MLHRLRAWLSRERHRPATDGFGQSLLDDLRYHRRFHRCRNRAVSWRLPADDERRSIDAHPIIGRFGDETYALANVDGRHWIVRDRTWYGWPDPPAYAFFVLAGEEIWAAADFDQWPRAWTGPAA